MKTVFHLKGNKRIYNLFHHIESKMLILNSKRETFYISYKQHYEMQHNFNNTQDWESYDFDIKSMTMLMNLHNISFI